MNPLWLSLAFILGYLIGGLAMRSHLYTALCRWGGHHFAQRFFKEKNDDEV